MYRVTISVSMDVDNEQEAKRFAESIVEEIENPDDSSGILTPQRNGRVISHSAEVLEIEEY
jgi:hypothetical protein